jgi:protocatechuate 3,4-dioxygenase alpha subunit
MSQAPRKERIRADKVVVSPYGTIGPFFPFAFVNDCNDLTEFEGRKARGQHIWLGGKVLEEGGQPTLHTILELWQPDANGIFRHPLDPRHADADPGFYGFGRAATDAQGFYRFRTIIPGPSQEPDGTIRCPHANLTVLAIGLTRRMVTTIFFSGSPAIVNDPVLRCVPESARHRLFAREDDTMAADGLPGYRFDVVLRGGEETPFFRD